MMFVKCNDKLI